MSFSVAALWSVAALFALNFVVWIVASATPSGQVDLVGLVLCQALAYVGTLFFLVQVHDRDRPLSDALGFRRTNLVLCLLAAAMGLALQGPARLAADVIYSRYPLSERELSQLKDLLAAPTLHQKVALAVAASLIGPFVEEVFFRGGILRNVRRKHPAGLTLIGTALLFAAAHVNPRDFLPDFMGGLAMGYVRILSGSLWPALLLHATFNSGSVYVTLTDGPEGNLFTRPESVAALGAMLALTGLFGWLAIRSDLCSKAREMDAG